MALPGIFLSNVRSLWNKRNDLALIRSKDFASCVFLSWSCGSVRTSRTTRSSWRIFIRVDWQATLSDKTTVGGLCFYINSGWCTDVTMIAQQCSPSLEYLLTPCKPFYFLRDFIHFDRCLHTARRGCVSSSMHPHRADTAHWAYSLIIALGDSNRAILSQELDKYKQHIKCVTREERTLDHCTAQ